MTSQRVAAIDCGTNTMRLLIADVDADAGSLTDVVRTFDVVRLGEGVDRTGALSPAAIRRALDTCRGYAATIADTGAAALRFVATSATRDAANREAFTSGVHEILGVTPEVLSGDAEARLAFAGATRGRSDPAPYLVVDVGGGSTELVLGDADGLRGAVSLDVGSVRLTERNLHGDPPTASEIDAARRAVEAALDDGEAAVPLREAATLVGVAGTAVCLGGLALGLPAFDPLAVHGAVVPAARVRALARELLAMSRAQRGALPFMHPGWVDVIGGGALVLDAVVERSGADALAVSSRDVLDGLAWSLAAPANDHVR